MFGVVLAYRNTLRDGQLEFLEGWWWGENLFFLKLNILLRPIYTVRFCRMQPPYDTFTTLLGHDCRKVLKHVFKSYNFFRVVSVS